ncbi:morphogenetic protein associated with SpoVID [Lentibacillus halodurans]|uniref:Morphogenetic protein associated with SpoVID n=1 Tax=Lentibacillus halodurans TaxID=237679 RepID=A0A1I0UYC0_9BACI|nr:SafA/ExsA family spore coat assembly protein [Lentibacillus halodurans]SFA69051.1 morphogenetic protein associated with SpoVID [Lentibacillus halodurans]
MKIHVVQKGDTLWEIAQQYGADFEQVKQLNPQLSSPDMILPGMKIKIPATSKPVKKEEAQQQEIQKEMQKPAAEKPYKDTSPKPMPVVKEDDVKQPKEIKPQMPMQPKMPSVEQEMNHYYTTINLPQIPKYTQPEDESSEKQKEMHYQQHPKEVHYQPHPKEMHYQPHPMPVMPLQHHMPCPPQPMPQVSPYAMGKKDCGCGGPKPMQMPVYQPMMQMPMHHQQMMHQPMHQQPMNFHHYPYDGNMMESVESSSYNMELPQKPMMKGSGSYPQPQAPNTMGIQQGFHYPQMPPTTNPHFSDNYMPMPPGFHKKHRDEEEESTSE